MTVDVALTFSELRSLITKAARGAGLDWGLAEEAGWAAEWLARRGLPAADWAADWLAARLQGALSPVEVGAALADACPDAQAADGRPVPDGLVAPGYLLPFLHRIAGTGGDLCIQSPSGLAVRVSGAGGVAFGPSWQPCTHGWRLAVADPSGMVRPVASRPVLSHTLVECLDGLALHTTVPPSESSRRDAGSLAPDSD